MGEYFGNHSVHGDVWPDGQSYCAFCDMLGTDNKHEHFLDPNAVDRYRAGTFRNQRAGITPPAGTQNVVKALAERTLDEDDKHWVRWALEKLGGSGSERDVYGYIRKHARYTSNRGKQWGLRRLPTHQVVEQLLEQLRET